jgi:hypothetical protein
MIQSMTGYGKSVVTYNGKKINVEVKSLNSKALDLSTRIAPLYREKEMEIRQIITAKLLRGKVDFAIWIDKDASVDAAPINTAVCGYKTMGFAHVRNPKAQGLSMGTAAHALGTATSMDVSNVHGAYASLGLTLNGIFTSLFTPTLVAIIC